MPSLKFGKAFNGNPMNIYNLLLSDFSAAIRTKNYSGFFSTVSAGSSTFVAQNKASGYIYEFGGSISYSGQLPAGQSHVDSITIRQPDGQIIISASGFSYTAAHIASATMNGFTRDFNALPWNFTGSDGNDQFTGGASDDLFNGGAGLDLVVFNAAKSEVSVLNKGIEGYAVSGSLLGSDTLKNVERLKFSDIYLALDLSGNAGLVAKTLGAVFGHVAVNNKEYAGIGIVMLDTGMSYESLMKLALDARLGINASNTDVVSLLYSNVVGVAPSEDELNFYTGLLENNYHTQASLGVLAAETSLNSYNINLVGLAQTGLEYQVN